MESNTSVVDGIRMPWEERGTGTPVILLHGIPTSPALWRHVAPKLDARVLAWEIVGYGESIVLQGRGRDHLGRPPGAVPAGLARVLVDGEAMMAQIAQQPLVVRGAGTA